MYDKCVVASEGVLPGMVCGTAELKCVVKESEEDVSQQHSK